MAVPCWASIWECNQAPHSCELKSDLIVITIEVSTKQNLIFSIRLNYSMDLGKNISYYKDYLIFLLLILISLILIFSNQNRQIEFVKLKLAAMIGFAQQEWTEIAGYLKLREKNESLLLENTRLALENSALQEMKYENSRLRNLIKFKEESNLELIAAKVIGKQKKGFINDIFLNVGTAEGVAKNMPVVISKGLVGKLHQVGKHRSNAQLLLDRNFRASAIVQRSRVKGIVAWQGGDRCVLNEVPNRSDVKVGDWVVTSGFSEIFPAGLKIGRIDEISAASHGLFMNISLKPAINFDMLEEVFVIVKNDAQKDSLSLNDQQ